ncbi:MAG TPA: hypothetical protein VGS23_01715 [Thermoplasmata archaeon]|nr:hypothetical protein [Thermoplasmata archaeon]
MNRFVILALGAGVSGLGIGAVVSSPDLSVVVAAAGLAVASAGTVAVLWVAPKVVRTHRSPVPVETDPIAELRDALRAGSLGRERVVFAVQSLEFSFRVRTGASRSPQEVRDLLALPTESFRGWLEARLDALERAT